MSNLSKALSADNKALVIRELSTMSIRKIMDAQETRQELEEQLDTLRKSYSFYKENKVADRVKHLAAIKKMASQLKDQLSRTPQFDYLVTLRTQNEDELLRTLKLMILSVVKYFNTTEVMSRDLVEETALRVAFNFGDLTLEDIALCFHQAQNGEHGKIYNRVDGAVIMDWLQTYRKRVQEIGMERNRVRHNQGKTGIWKDGHEYRIIQPTRIKELI